MGKPVCLENRETLEVLQKAYFLTKITTLDPVVKIGLLREGFPPGGAGRGGARARMGGLGLVEWMPWHVWVMCPWRVSSEVGQYLAALEYVRPSKVSQLPALIASSHVCLTGKPRQA